MSATLSRLTKRIPRYIRRDVKAQARWIINACDDRIHAYWCWSDFGLGVNVCKPSHVTGFKACVSINLAFLNLWFYLFKIKSKQP